MNNFLDSTQFTFDFATPPEGAVAAFHDGEALGAEPAAAAHEVASVDPDAGVVAGPPVRAGDAEARVPLAEAGRRLQVHQVLRPRRFVVGVVRPQLESVPVSARHPVRRGVVSLSRHFQIGIM